MTDETKNSPITFLVRVERTVSEYAIIPVVAMDNNEAKAKAKAKTGESHHTWQIFQSELRITNQIEARGLTSDHQAEQYKKGNL